MTDQKRFYSIIALICFTTFSLIVVYFLPPIPQWLGYHDFADSRKIGGIPNLLYGIAKIFEKIDWQVYRLGEIISGHTLKHLFAAAGIYFFVVILKKIKFEPRN